MAKQTGFHQINLQRRQWTQDILFLMSLVEIIAILIVGGGTLAGLFNFYETLPLYVMTGVTLAGWLMTRSSRLPVPRALPALLLFSIGIYAEKTSGFNTTMLFFALAIFLAGMLINRAAQWTMLAACLGFSVLGLVLMGNTIFLDNLPRVITNAFMLIGLSLLQWYYDTRLERTLTRQIEVNHALATEIELRTEAELNLREQERQLRRLAENTTDLVSEVDAAGKARYVSPSHTTSLGYPAAGLVNTNLFDLVHPDDLSTAMELARRNSAVNQPGTMEMRLRHADGHYVHFQVVATPLIDGHGQLEGYVMSSRDISQRKAAETANRQSEEKFRSIIESSPLGIYMLTFVDDDCMVLSGYNHAADTILGIDHAAFVGKNIEEAFPELGNTSLSMNYRRVAFDGLSWSNMMVVYQGDSVRSAYEITAFRSSPGNMVVMFLDITPRIRADMAMRQSEEKFSKAFLTSPDSININRMSDGMYIDINQGWTNLTGYTREETLGKTSAEIGIWADMTDRDRLVRLLSASGKVENLEARFRLKNGSIKVGLMSASVIEINHEKCILSIVRDISERIRAVEQLQEAHAQLEQAYEDTLQGWVRTLELREHETADHSRRVVELTIKVAQALGIEENALKNIERGALLHDIGKIGVPDSILLKPGQLTPEEWIIMRYHPRYAYELMTQIPFLRESADIPFAHHERWDGQGYPRGISAESIPLAARIFSVVDVYDALLSDRPYRPAWSHPDVLQYLVKQKEAQFDPQIVDLFLRLIQEPPEKVSEKTDRAGTAAAQPV